VDDAGPVERALAELDGHLGLAPPGDAFLDGPGASARLDRPGRRDALLAGRLAASPNDIKRVALPVLRHRVLLNFAAEAEGVSVERIIDDLLERVEPPRSDIRL